MESRSEREMVESLVVQQKKVERFGWLVKWRGVRGTCSTRRPGEDRSAFA